MGPKLFQSSIKSFLTYIWTRHKWFGQVSGSIFHYCYFPMTINIFVECCSFYSVNDKYVQMSLSLHQLMTKNQNSNNQFLCYAESWLLRILLAPIVKNQPEYPAYQFSIHSSDGILSLMHYFYKSCNMKREEAAQLDLFSN